jgi:hypothetical protein
MCNICGNEFIKKDYRKYGVVAIVVGIVLFPLLYAIEGGLGTPSIFFVILFSIGLYRILKKDRFFYYCKKCGIKIPEREIERNRGRVHI